MGSGAGPVFTDSRRPSVDKVPAPGPSNALKLHGRSRDVPSPQELQRQADEWLTWLRREAGRRGWIPIRCGRARLDVLDALRSQMELNNALVLGGRDQPPRSWRAPAYRVKSFVERHLAMPRNVPTLEQPKVLAIPRQPGHLHDLIPVARALRREHGVETVFALVDRQLLNEVSRAGFCSVGLHTFSTPSPAERFRIYGLAGHLAGLPASCASFGAEEAARLAASSLDVLRALGPRVGDVSRAVQCLLVRLEPLAVVVGNPYTLEGRTAALTAGQMSIPTVALEHGTIFPRSPRWYECPADLVCVWGQPSQRALESSGVSSERIRITGAPRFDDIFGTFDGAYRPEGVLVASSGPGDQVSLDDHMRFIDLIYAAAARLPNSRWTIKLHPKDKEQYYLRDGRLGTERVRIVRGEKAKTGVEIFEFLRSAAVLITVASSTALDAMSVGVPVVSVAVGATAEGLAHVEFLSRGCTRRVSSTKALAKEVRDALAGLRHQETELAAKAYAAEHFANRGNAGSVVAAQIMQIRSERRRSPKVSQFDAGAENCVRGEARES